MKPIATEDLKENDFVEGYYKDGIVKGKVKQGFGSLWLEVKARPGGRIRLPLKQIEPIRVSRKGV